MGIVAGWEVSLVSGRNARGENRLLTARVEPTPQDLSRNYARSLVQLELGYHSGFNLRLGIVGALPLAISQLISRAVENRTGCRHTEGGYRASGAIGRQIAFRRHHDREFARELHVA